MSPSLFPLIQIRRYLHLPRAMAGVKKSRNTAHVQYILEPFEPAGKVHCRLFLFYLIFSSFVRLWDSHLRSHADTVYRPVSLHGFISICGIAFASPHESLHEARIHRSAYLLFGLRKRSSIDCRVRRIVLSLLAPYLWSRADPALREL